MGRLVIKKRLSLAFIGEGWEEAYMLFKPISSGEAMELAKLENKVTAGDNSDDNIARAEDVLAYGKKLITAHFISGMGFAGEFAEDGKPKLVELEPKEVVEDLFDEVYIPFLRAARGSDNQNL